MWRILCSIALLTMASVLVFAQTENAAAKQPKCAASTVEDFEGTDMSGATAKCLAIFNDCVNESLACNARLQKCKAFDKMDRDGSCYKSR